MADAATTPTTAASTKFFFTASLFLKLFALVLFHPVLVGASSRETWSSPSPPVVVTTTSTTCYPPSTSSRGGGRGRVAEEESRWIAEEEFHGASSLFSKKSSSSAAAASERPKTKIPKHFPILNNDGHERVEEHPSWWDDDDDDTDDDTDDDGQRERSGSIRGIGVVDDKDDDEIKEQRTKTSKPGKTRRTGLRLRIFRKTKRKTILQHEESSSSNTTNHPAEELQSKKGSIQSNSQPSSVSSEYDEEHPMRTDEWLLNIRLSPFYPLEEGDYYFPECNNYFDASTTTSLPQKKQGGNSRRTKRQVMQFARNGYVKVVEEDETTRGRDDIIGGGGLKKRYKPRVGKWRMGHSGVAFDIPIQMQVVMKTGGVGGKRNQLLVPYVHAGGGGDGSEDTAKSRVTTTMKTVLHYHADIHLNKFGERPRMFKGVITRDRYSPFLPPNFLRPVIGTFSAEGIGHDTADTSYRDRAISLSRQQVINEAKGVR